VYKLKNRIEQLDSIRGLASIIVVFHHLFLVFPMMPFLLRISPMKVIVNGHASVIMFFVLSGFVLSLPFLKGSTTTYRSFVIKRVIRIYIPYLASIFLAVLMASLLSGKHIQGMGTFFTETWQTGITFKLFIEHLFLVYNPDFFAYNSVTWSLVHEMRISLFFPLLALCIIRYNWKVNLFICLLLSSPSVLKELLPLSYRYESLVDTMHYTSFFILGALLAKNKGALTTIYLQWSKKRKWSILIFTFLLYGYSTTFTSTILKLGLTYGIVVGDYVASIGASAFIIYAIGSIKLSSLLMKKQFLFLGQISYSLYLIHCVALLSFIYLFYGSLPHWLFYIITICTSLLLATISWRYIEKPSIALGKRLTQGKKGSVVTATQVAH
jgi:peptidoglycan/LPS O-acetylase OafA/YrhL